MTGETHRVIVPSGYKGNTGEIWFVRLLHEPFQELNYGYAVVFTTPYVRFGLSRKTRVPAKREDWEAFFQWKKQIFLE